MIDTQAFKQAFLAGDKDAVMYHDKKAKECSNYQSNIRGLQVEGDRRAVILDYNRQSFVQHTIPDPTLIATTKSRFRSIKNDRELQKTRMRTSSLGCRNMTVDEGNSQPAFGILGTALSECISSKGAVREVQPVMYQRRASEPPVTKLQKTFDRSRKSYW